jgi:pimeloyl-ACP methyl ester carboxylesterase
MQFLDQLEEYRMKVFRLLLRVALVLLALSLSVALGAATFYGIAPYIDNVLLLVVVALVVVGLVAGLGMRWATKHRAATYITFVGWPLLLLLTFVVKIHAPSAQPIPVPPMANMQYWSLDTGSRIAYTKIPAAGSVRGTPIVFLHGGPGWLVMDSDVAFYSQLSKLGFDVYLYDQVGSGRSSRLADMRQYDTARQVADLEAIRTKITAGKIILIGQSWGNTLAVDYMAAHPGHVEKVIFSSPGAMWDVSRFRFDYSHSASVGEDPGFTPAIIAALFLTGRNPAIAQQIVSDSAMETFMDTMPTSVKVENNYCAGDEARISRGLIAGSNNYVNKVVFTSQKSYPDPRPALRGNPTPALVLRGACDFVPLEFAKEYVATFPQSQMVQIQNAGHALYEAQPAQIYDAMASFLNH